MARKRQAPTNKLRVVFVTSSTFKQEENKAFHKSCFLAGQPVKDQVDFEFRNATVRETLEVDLEAMVREEVTLAYSQIQVPCIVEHAGLIFEDYAENSYPGGLTKPMWNTLEGNFLNETNSAGRPALARAVIAYCDGMRVRAFVGETQGRLADKPRGRRKFYWDTVFIPDTLDGKPGEKTYAEICDDPKLGLAHKMREYSQSARAMLKFLEFLRENSRPELWNH